MGAAGNIGAAGAKIRIYEAGTANLLWFEQVAIFCKQSVQSYYAHSQTERHFGLGGRDSVDVEVSFYPSGKCVCASGAAANSTVVVNESDAGCACATAIEYAMKRPGLAGLTVTPNPFHAAVTISLANCTGGIQTMQARNSRNAAPTLAIYDVHGRMVHQARNFTTGRHVWNARGLPAGLYIARLRTGGNVLTRQLLLLK